MTASFVKAETTTVSVEKSKGELERMVRRYGADAFSVVHDYANGRAQVSFLVADAPTPNAPKVPVRIDVHVQQVYHALYGMPLRWDPAAGKRVQDLKGYVPKKMEQAERVAWRNLLLWVDAQLSATSIGLQTITEAFMAHAVIGPEGQRGRDYLADMLDGTRLLGSGTPPQ